LFIHGFTTMPGPGSTFYEKNRKGFFNDLAIQSCKLIETKIG
jgi:hypothetical protein